MMMKLLSNGLVIAGMLTVPVSVTNAELPDAKAEYRNDPRLETLKKFFKSIDCPAQDFAEEFLKAADRHKLDWRLLPSLSVMESGGGHIVNPAAQGGAVAPFQLAVQLGAALQTNSGTYTASDLVIIDAGGNDAADLVVAYLGIFSSVRASIHGVAEHLATSKLYRDKDLDHMLRMYTPNVNYPGVVKSVMRRISPSQ